MDFRDRREAGRQLAEQLRPLRAEQPIVVAIPRGGVPVAFEIARALGAPLDVLAVRKLGAPANPELGVGAIAEDGSAALDRDAARRVGLTQAALDETVERETRELRRRVLAYRDGRPPIDVRGRTVIVVDDGLATGLTDLAAVRALRDRGAGRIVVAIPVGAPESVALVGEEADEVVCQTIPRSLQSVGRWYRDFSPVGDDEVRALLAAHRGEQTPAAADGATPTSGDHAAPGAPRRRHADLASREVRLLAGDVELTGDLTRPASARGLVVFAHGSGSSRLSPRNRAVASALNRGGFATLLLDLLTPDEAARRELVFDIPLLARRLELVTRWAVEDPATSGLPIGYFGASTGAGAALRAAAAIGDVVRAVVSRGGRPDLAADRLPLVRAATLLIVGGRDTQVLDLNRRAAEMLRCPHRLVVVDGATHLFEEPGALEAVAELAASWFAERLRTRPPRLAAAGA
jgi:predicted phosphoribosyltransferase/dienelactone hydrolase